MSLHGQLDALSKEREALKRKRARSPSPRNNAPVISERELGALQERLEFLEEENGRLLAQESEFEDVYVAYENCLARIDRLEKVTLGRWR